MRTGSGVAIAYGNRAPGDLWIVDANTLNREMKHRKKGCFEFPTCEESTKSRSGQTVSQRKD